MSNIFQIIIADYWTTLLIIINLKYNFQKVLTMQIREKLWFLRINSFSTIRTYLECLNIDKEVIEADFEDIKCKRGQKLADWKKRTLLAADKVALIKSTLTGIYCTMNGLKYQNIFVQLLIAWTWILFGRVIMKQQ